ncbi:MAG: hypothetical protein COA78_06435 [Blastopirellula sp.]|nr:MAG: hypothetical protein COA78_06435 [Blastopirellula sp.]
MMRYSIKAVFAATTIIAIGIWAAIWFLSPTIYTATLLNRTSLRTDAPQRIVGEAYGEVYSRMRLRHFTDAKGQVTFEDGTSRDTTYNESVSVLGEVTNGVMNFDDPDGNKVTFKWITEPKIGTLLTWEYEGKDPQDVSVAIQKALAAQGVAIK